MVTPWLQAIFIPSVSFPFFFQIMFGKSHNIHFLSMLSDLKWVSISHDPCKRYESDKSMNFDKQTDKEISISTPPRALFTRLIVILTAIGWNSYRFKHWGGSIFVDSIHTDDVAIPTLEIQVHLIYHLLHLNRFCLGVSYLTNVDFIIYIISIGLYVRYTLSQILNTNLIQNFQGVSSQNYSPLSI